MDVVTIPFFLVPLLVYTYFWLNPFALSAFATGISRYFLAVYLGYKAYMIGLCTEIEFWRYKRASIRLSLESNFPRQLLGEYFDSYKTQDKNSIRLTQKAIFERRHRKLEELFRDLVAD